MSQALCHDNMTCIGSRGSSQQWTISNYLVIEYTGAVVSHLLTSYKLAYPLAYDAFNGAICTICCLLELVAVHVIGSLLTTSAPSLH